MRTLAFILRYILPFFEGKGEKSACSVTDTISRPVKVRSFHFPGFSHLVALHSQQPAAIAAAKSLQSCPTLRPHRRQPTRLLCPWDSPGKNAGVGCHFLLQYMKVESESEVAQSCPTLWDPMDCSLSSSVHGSLQSRVLEWAAIAQQPRAPYMLLLILGVLSLSPTPSLH